MKDKEKGMKDLTQRLKECFKKESQYWYDTAVLSYQVIESEEWKRKGYASVKEYVLNEFADLGVSYQVFMYRVKMGEAIFKYDLRREDLEKFGWTKFKDMASYLMMGDIETEEIMEVIEKANELSTREFANFIRYKKKTYIGEHKDVPVMELRLKFFGDQIPIIEQALKLAFQFSQTDNASVAFLYIATDFLMNHSTDDEVISRIREEVIKKIEERRKIIHTPHNIRGRKK